MVAGLRRLDDGSFHDYSFTLSASGTYGAYRDGALIDTAEANCSTGPIVGTLNQKRIGARTCDNQYSNATYEYFGVFLRELSALEISDVYLRKNDA